MSRDLSCSPHEILKLKIRDIAFKTTGNYQYAEVVVNGKTGTRPIPLINSIPYLKDYLDHEHSQPTNPNSPLICGTGKGLGRHIRPARIYNIYYEYKEQIFPKLLESPILVSLEIKATDIISLAEDYLSDLLVYELLPVKIFRAAIGRNEEKDMVELQDQINEFEKELEEHGMRI